MLAASTAIGAPAAALPEAPRQDAVRAHGKADADAVRAMIGAGHVVRAESLLHEGVRRGAIDAVDSLALQQRLETATARLSPAELSTQRAEFQLEHGRLRLAEMHASAVLASDASSRGQTDRARLVMRELDARRTQMERLAPGLIDQAETAASAGAYAEARRALMSIRDAGVALDASQEARLGAIAMLLLDASSDQAEATPAVLSAMPQAGVVRRTGGGQEEGGDQPQAEPAQDTPAGDDLIQAARRAEAQRRLAVAQQNLAERRLSQAMSEFRLLLAQYRDILSEEEIARATDGLTEASLQLNQGTPGGIQANEEGSVQLRRDRAMAQFENLMSRATLALDGAQTASARELAATARLTINQNRDVFGQADFDAFIDRVDELSAQVELAAERLRLSERAAQDAERRREQALAAQNARARTEQQIRDSIDRVRALQAERKYSEALQVLEQVLFMEPHHADAQLLYDLIYQIDISNRFRLLERIKRDGMVAQRMDNAEATSLPTNIIDFPTDWREKSIMRGGSSALAETPEDRAVLATIATTRVPVTFTQTPLSDVLTFVEQVSTLNVDVDWESLRDVGISEDTEVTLSLTNVPLRVMLDRVAAKISTDEFSKADWAVRDGILLVASDQELRKNRVLAIYNITDLLFDVPDYNEVPDIDLQSLLQQGGEGGGGGGQSPFEDNQDDDGGDRPTRQEKIDNLIEIITENVDSDGWAQRGGETGAIQEFQGNLIITNTPKNHRAIDGLLGQLRAQRSMQINVETKFLIVNQDWFEEIGFDLDIVLNADNNQVRLAQATDPSVQPSDFFDFTAGGLQRTIEGASDGTATVPQRVVNPRPWSPIGVGGNSFGLASGLASGNEFASGLLAAAPALGLAGQFLDDIQVDFLIRATQADRRSVELTAPRLTFTNGQTANIFVATQQLFVSDLDPVTGDSAVGFDPQIDPVSEGVTLLVEGYITHDRRYVTLNVDAQVGQIAGIRTAGVTAVAGGQLVNSADTQSFVELPTVTVTRVRTTVTVPDEGTILLGGQRLITELEIETGVPVLSKLPVINRFFTNRIQAKEEQTLLILIKPTVLIQAEEEERQNPGLLDELRLGLGG